MIRIFNLKAFVFGACLMIFSGLCFAEDLANGKAIYLEVCASCHGQYGEVSNDVIPDTQGKAVIGIGGGLLQVNFPADTAVSPNFR